MKQKLLFVLELVLLAGMIALSFYLLYLSFEEGERAVNGTAVVTENETGETSGNTARTEGLAGSEEEEEAAPTGGDAQEMKAEGSALLGTADTESLDIRVQILDNAYTDDTFDVITVCGSGGIWVESGTITDGTITDGTMTGGTTADKVETGGGTFVEAGTEYAVSASDLREAEVLRLTPGDEGTLTVTSLERADGAPEYAGELYIYRLEEGLALVNELPLEEYLYAVVSSEMPSYFPEEALKAQAVCARTYALLCLENEKTIADLDDSVKFQVYNNRKYTQSSRKAVDETAGVVLTADEVLYYSTSCLSEGRTDLDEETAFREFLQEVPEDGAEYGSAWLRWSVTIPVSRILDRLAGEYGIWADAIETIAVEERSGSGQVQMLRVIANGETLEIEGEYAIRQFLSPEGEDVALMDGTKVSGLQLLPSAFFYMDAEAEASGERKAEEMQESESSGENDLDEKQESDSLYLYGGGYGHGNGMSQ
ncbi:MAG: SpoIID/LytB domain-containing protein [Lachnospiraceae bacterium]|nr:SpoIID/LytB domain-containing protein [Lachnospiraceae bacterium]